MGKKSEDFLEALGGSFLSLRENRPPEIATFTHEA